MKKLIIIGISLLLSAACATINVEKTNPDGSTLKGSYTRLGSQNLDDVTIEESKNGTSKIKIGKQKSNGNEELIDKFIEFLKSLN